MNSLTSKLKVSMGKQYFFSTIILFAFITVLYPFQDSIGYRTVSLILLLVVFLLPLFNFEKGPVILAAIISALAWDYYFIPPHFTMHIAEAEDVVMLFLFFVAALTNGILTSKLKEQRNILTEKEWRSNALYQLVKNLSNSKDINDVCSIIIKQIFGTFGYETVIYFPVDQVKLDRNPNPASTFTPDEMEWLAAEAAFLEGKETGKLTDTVQGADAIYLPVKDKTLVLCIIGIKIDYEFGSDTGRLNFLKLFIEEIKPYVQKNMYHSIP